MTSWYCNMRGVYYAVNVFVDVGADPSFIIRVHGANLRCKSIFTWNFSSSGWEPSAEPSERHWVRWCARDFFWLEAHEAKTERIVRALYPLFWCVMKKIDWRVFPPETTGSLFYTLRQMSQNPWTSVIVAILIEIYNGVIASFVNMPIIDYGRNTVVYDILYGSTFFPTYVADVTYWRQTCCDVAWRWSFPPKTTFKFSL